MNSATLSRMTKSVMPLLRSGLSAWLFTAGPLRSVQSRNMMPSQRADSEPFVLERDLHKSILKSSIGKSASLFSRLSRALQPIIGIIGLKLNRCRIFLGRGGPRSILHGTAPKSQNATIATMKSLDAMIHTNLTLEGQERFVQKY